MGSDESGKRLGTSLNLSCGAAVDKSLQLIVNARGEAVPATETVWTGSLLQIIEPQEVVWNEYQELYPIIFVAVGAWDETASVTPPEGFVSDHDSLSVLVDDSEARAVQFTLTDIGSEWIPTLTRHELLHNERREIVLGGIAIGLGQAFAASKGLDEWGRPLGPDGEAELTPPVSNPAGRLEGWIEAGPVDPVWVFKVEMFREAHMTIVIETMDRRLVDELVASPGITPGNYVFYWDPTLLSEPPAIETLQVRFRTEQVDKAYPLRRPVTPEAPRLPEVTIDTE